MKPNSPALQPLRTQMASSRYYSIPILQRLANMHFARKESGRFYLHPVDREFAFRLIPDDESEDDDVFTDYESHFTQHDLTLLAADYFAAARKPRAEWKKLDDLSAQMAEFDLRCAAGDYDMACSILDDIDFDYLYSWGHFNLIINLHMRVKDKLRYKSLIMVNMNGLGVSHFYTGRVEEARVFCEIGLQTAEDEINRGFQAIFLGGLGLIYAHLGDASKAIEFDEQAIRILHDIGDTGNEGNTLVNNGLAYLLSGDYRKSIYYLQQAIEIVDQVSLSVAQLEARWGLAQAYLLQNDLLNAHIAIEAALQYDDTRYNHNASALHGIIALRQGDEVAARGAFVRAIGQADEILSKTAEYYSALDAKGLAICGLTICDLPQIGRAHV